MSEFQTASQLDPIGGREDPERPSQPFNAYDVPQGGRDAQTDDRSISDAEGQMSDELDMSGWLCDPGVTTIGHEARAMGWDPLAEPSGAPPKPLHVSGTRGADDIGKM